MKPYKYGTEPSDIILGGETVLKLMIEWGEMVSNKNFGNMPVMRRGCTCSDDKYWQRDFKCSRCGGYATEVF